MKKKLKGTCRKCGQRVLTTSEFETECRNAGFIKDASTGSFKVPIGRSTEFKDNPAARQAQYNRIEERRGYQCKGCGSIYCLNCLYTSARNHPSGGKACPKCGSTFAPYVEPRIRLNLGQKEAEEMSISVDDIRRILKSACKPVVTPPEFKKRLLERLVLETINKQLLEHLATKGEAPEGGCETRRS